MSSEAPDSKSVSSVDSTPTTLSVEDMIYKDIKEKMFIDVDCDELRDIQKAVEGFLSEISEALEPTPFKIQEIVPGGSVPEKTRLWDFDTTSTHHCEACSIHMCSDPFLEFDYLAVLPNDGIEIVHQDCCIGFKQVVTEQERFRECIDVNPRFQNDPIERVNAEKLLHHFSACVRRIIMTKNSDNAACTASDGISGLDPFVNGIVTPSGDLSLDPHKPWWGFTWHFKWKSKINSLRPPKLCGLVSNLKYDTIAVHVDFLPVFEYYDDDDDDDVAVNVSNDEQYVEFHVEQNDDCNLRYDLKGVDEKEDIDNNDDARAVDNEKNGDASVAVKSLDKEEEIGDVIDRNEDTAVVVDEQHIDQLNDVEKCDDDQENKVGKVDAVKEEVVEIENKVELVKEGYRVGKDEGHECTPLLPRHDNPSDDGADFKNDNNVDDTGEESFQPVSPPPGSETSPNGDDDAEVEDSSVSQADLGDESDCSKSDYLKYLVPRICHRRHGCCWKVSTLLEERKMITNSSPAHREAYKVLKFLFTTMKKQDVGFGLTSYILKTILFYHLKHNQCPEKGESVKGCIHEMLQLMSGLYKIGNVPNFFNRVNLLRRPCIFLEDSTMANGYDGIVDCIIRVLMNADVIFKADYCLWDFITCIHTSVELHEDAYEHVLRENLACTVWSEAIDLNWKNLRRLQFTSNYNVMGDILLEKVNAPIFCAIL